MIIIVHESLDELARFVNRQRHVRPNAIGLERLVPPFDFPVALWIVRRSLHVRHTALADELLKILGDKLGAVVGDDSWSLVGKRFFGPLQCDLDVRFGHALTQFPVNQITSRAVQYAD